MQFDLLPLIQYHGFDIPDREKKFLMPCFLVFGHDRECCVCGSMNRMWYVRIRSIRKETINGVVNMGFKHQKTHVSWICLLDLSGERRH
jgi:hypothetical protein